MDGFWLLGKHFLYKKSKYSDRMTALHKQILSNLGVINRAMPQLMVAFVGAPAITAAGLLLLALAAPILLDIWAGWMRGVMRNPLEVP